MSSINFLSEKMNSPFNPRQTGKFRSRIPYSYIKSKYKLPSQDLILKSENESEKKLKTIQASIYKKKKTKPVKFHRISRLTLTDYLDMVLVEN